MNTTIRIIPSLGAVHLDVRRYEAAIAQGWRFEALPDGQCLIVPPGKTPWAGAEVFVARDLAAAVQFLSLEIADTYGVGDIVRATLQGAY